MKTLLTAATALLALGLFAEPETNRVDSALREEGTDEIDLEEVDDAALAAKKASVKATEDKDRSFVDISCDEATIADILRQFRKTTRANIISDDSTNLQKRVSAELRHVPWTEALTSILNARGFELEDRKGIYFVKEKHEEKPLLTRPFPLKHASSLELANLFNATYAPKDKSGKIIAPIANSFDGANVVVVTAHENVIRDCERIIEAVDKAVAQVYIEARFLELSNEALHRLGIQWDALESWQVSATGLKAGWQSARGTPAIYDTKVGYTAKNMVKTGTSSTTSESSSSKSDTYTDLANGAPGIANAVMVPTTINEATRAGLTAADMAWEDARGFSGQLSAQDFSLALSAFESLGEGKIFSNPKIIVSNGKEAKVDMTTKEPNVSVAADYTGTSSQNLSISTKLDVIPGEDKLMFAKEAFFSWGITLSVKPRISPDGLITVEIVPTISEHSGDKEVKGATANSVYTTYPIIDVKRLTTEFTMKDGSTAVIGGLSHTVEEDVDSGIPYLRKIPWIGPKLFGWKSREKSQKEIIVCVTLGIADPGSLQKDIGLPTNAVLGREYVRGHRQEPGLRSGDADEVLRLNKDSLDDQRERRAEENRTEEEKKPAPEREVPAEPKPGEVRMSLSALAPQP